MSMEEILMLMIGGITGVAGILSILLITAIFKDKGPPDF